MLSHVDRGYAWVVLLAAVLQHLLYACPLGTLGIFLVEMKGYYGCTKTQISLLAMLSFVVGMLSAYPIGRLTKRVGTRRMSLFASLLGFSGYAASAYASKIEILYLVYGAFTSVSHYCQYVVNIAAIQNWFDVRRGLACGLLMAASSVGSFFWPPVATHLIHIYGWRGAIFIISAVQLHGVVFGLFLKRPPKPKQTVTECETEETTHIEQDTPPVQQTKIRRFLPFGLLLPCIGLVQAGYFVYITYLPMRMNELGMCKSKASLLFSLIGAAGIILRPIVGVISDYKWISRVLLFGISTVIGGGLTVASMFFSTTVMLAVYAVGCGVTSAGYMGVQPALAVDLLGRKYNEVATGAVVTSMGFAHMVLHPVSGWLMDAYQDSALPFCIFGACQLAGGLLTVVVWLLHRTFSRGQNLIINLDNVKPATTNGELAVTLLTNHK